ncbi:MAG TPA: hypothetical protein VGA98_03830 [Allosphingosinicella sp.]
MHQTIAAFAGAALLALLAAAFVPRLKSDLGRVRFWLALAAASAALGAGSAFFAETGHAGTGFVTRQGWPKPFRFEFASELGERSSGFEPIYFAGNMLVYAAVLLLAWTALQMVRTAAAASSARSGI